MKVRATICDVSYGMEESADGEPCLRLLVATDSWKGTIRIPFEQTTAFLKQHHVQSIVALKNHVIEYDRERNRVIFVG